MSTRHISLIVCSENKYTKLATSNLVDWIKAELLVMQLGKLTEVACDAAWQAGWGRKRVKTPGKKQVGFTRRKAVPSSFSKEEAKQMEGEKFANPLSRILPALRNSEGNVY
jgi:hypothetical protein